jgi:hypothetical protein
MSNTEIVKCRSAKNGWRVEREDDDGGVEVTVFYGNNPEARAYAFAKLIDF